MVRAHNALQVRPRGVPAWSNAVTTVMALGKPLITERN